MSSLTQRTNFNYSNKGNIVNLKQNIKNYLEKKLIK